MSVKFLCEVLFLCFTIIITISTTIVHIITNSSRRPVPTPIDNSIEDPIHIYISIDCVIYSLVTVSSCYHTYRLNIPNEYEQIYDRIWHLQVFHAV